MSPPQEHAWEAAGPGHPLWGGALPLCLGVKWGQQGPPRSPVPVGASRVAANSPQCRMEALPGAAGGEWPWRWAVRGTEAGVRLTTGQHGGAGEHGEGRNRKGPRGGVPTSAGTGKRRRDRGSQEEQPGQTVRPGQLLCEPAGRCACRDVAQQEQTSTQGKGTSCRVDQRHGPALDAHRRVRLAGCSHGCERPWWDT